MKKSIKLLLWAALACGSLSLAACSDDEPYVDPYVDPYETIDFENAPPTCWPAPPPTATTATKAPTKAAPPRSSPNGANPKAA